MLDRYSHPSFMTMIPVLGTCLIILFGTEDTVVGKILSWKYVVGVGLISYSLYLWHVPIFVFARHYDFMFNLENNNYYYLSNTKYFFLIIVIFILSYFSWKYVEQPFRQIKSSKNNSKQKKISDKNLIKLGISSFLIIFLSGFFINKNDGFTERFSNKVSNYLNYEYSYPSNELINPCRESFKEKFKRKVIFRNYKQKEIFDECRILGYKNKNPKVVLIGDSVTHSLLPTFKDYLTNKKKSVYYYSENCFKSEEFAENSICQRIFEAVLNDTNIENLILFFRWPERLQSLNYFKGIYFCGDIKCKNQAEVEEFRKRGKKIQKSFKERVNLLLDKNKKVTIIYPLPYIGIDPPKYLATKVLNKQRALAAIDYDETIYRNSSVKEFFDSFEDNISRVYPDKIFCNTYIKDKCVVNFNEKVFFVDSTHLSLDGGVLLANNIFKKINF